MSLLWAKRGWLTPGSQTVRLLERFGASDVWDFVDNSYMRAGVVTTNAGLTVTRASEGYAQREDGIWVNFASGALRRTDKGALIEGARTNRALHSRDLTQAAWTATNVTVARNQVGIDGLANTACSLTATAGNGTVLQAVTHASTARYFSVWIKRITGTGTVEVTLDNGSTWTAVTVTSAYTRVGAAQTLANPTVGVRLVTDTDAVAVDFAQLEDGAFPSSPIATDGTAVTRAADSVNVASFVTSGLVAIGSGFAEGTVSSVTSGDKGALAFVDGNGRVIEVSTATIRTFDGTNVVSSGISATANTAFKAASAWSGVSLKISANGNTPGSGTFDGAMGSTGDLLIGRRSPGNELQGYLRRVAIFTSALTDAQLQAITS